MFAILLPLLVAAAPAADVVARIDSEAISAAALKQRVDAERARGTTRRPEEVLQTLIDEALLHAYGRGLGLARDAEVVTTVDDERHRLAAELFQEKEIDGSIPVDEAMLREAYHQGADTVQLKLVVVATRQQAEEILERLRKGGDFSVEARGSLDGRAKASGGDLGVQARRELDPALAAAAFAAEPGALVGPVELKLGFGVARVLERHVGDEPGFAAKREALRKFVFEQVAHTARRHFLDRERAAAGAALDEAFLRTTGMRIEASPEEEQHVLAAVRGRQLTYGMVLPEVRRLARGQANTHFSGPAVKVEIASLALDGFVLEDAALKRGYDKAPAVVEQLREVERSAIVAVAARLARGMAPAAGEAEIEAFYAQHAAEYQRPGHRACAHILLSTKARAEQLRERARHGEPFEALAREHSEDRETGQAGGRLGDIDDARLEALAGPEAEPALAAAVRDTRPGAVSAPVRSRAGWHLFRCSARVPPAPAPLAEVLSSVAGRVAAERAEAALRRKLAELRAGARISVDGDALTRAVPRAT